MQKERVKSLQGLTSRHHNTIRVDSQGVDYGLVTSEILQEIAIWQFPYLDIVGRPTGKAKSE